MHLNIFTNRVASVLNLINMIIPQAIAASTDSTPGLRKSLPRNISSYFGVAHSENEDDNKRQHFQTNVNSLLKGIVGEALDMMDAAVDQVCYLNNFKEQYIIVIKRPKMNIE